LIAAIVLAAGGSSRMGRPKMLLPLPGGTVLATAVARLLAAPLDRVVVVVGSDAARVRREAALPDDPRLAVVENPAWEGGMSTSLRTGVLACPEARALLVSLGDQPAVDPDLVRRLVEAWRGGARLAVPVHPDAGGLRAGHPVLFDASLRDELLGLAGDVGAREVLRRHLHAAARIEAPSPRDLDTPEEYRAFLETGEADSPGGAGLAVGGAPTGEDGGRDDAAEPPPRIALVGCGRWGRSILQELRGLGCGVSVVDTAAESRDRARAEGADDAVEALGRLGAVAGVVVATPATTHAEVVGEALHLGVPVFAEKPLTTDPEQAARLAARAGGRLFVMHVWRYHPGVEALAAIAASEELGPVEAVRTTRTGWTSPRSDTDPVWTLAPHDLSIALALLGALPAPRWAVAERRGGRPVGLVAALGERPCVVLEVSTRHPERRREVRLHCRDGVAALVGETGAIDVARDVPEDPLAPPVRERRPYPDEPALRRELRAFVTHLAGGPPPRTTAAEGVEVVGVLAELRRLAGL